MLDGLLGRGFSSKCKSSIKLIKARIDGIRRKKNAMLKFLKKDIAEILINGHDTNAYGRAEGLIVELNLSSCYDFVEQSCGCIAMHLSVMQKQRECPEECKEAVSSLMFAAARFADLPELRDLRHIFTERYGKSLESFVNQEFVDKLASKPPTTDKKLQLMRDIAREFSVNWDSKAFEQKISNPTASAQDQPKRHEPFHDPNNDGNKPRINTASKRDTQDVSSRGRRELADDGYKPHNGREDTIMKRENLDDFSNGRKEFIDNGYKPSIGREYTIHRRENQDNLSNGRWEPAPGHTTRQQAKANSKEGKNHNGPPSHANLTKKVFEEETESMKPYHNVVIPPPYVKPNGGKYGTQNASSDCNEASTDPSAQNRDIVSSRSDRTHTRSDGVNYERQQVAVNGHGNENNHHHEDDLVGDTKSKPKSVRRRHLKPPPGHDYIGNTKDHEVKKKIPSGRRRDDPRQGLQHALDDDHNPKDEEERVMDKLLMHYSKKPSTFESVGARAGAKAPPLHDFADTGESQRHRSRDKVRLNSEAGHHPARTVSLPPEPVTSTEAGRGPARATSFQPELLNPAGHVHPKLPDYDDLPARIAALRGR